MIRFWVSLLGLVKKSNYPILDSETNMDPLLWLLLPRMKSIHEFIYCAKVQD